MAETITVAPYKLIDTYYTSEGSCIDCGAKIGVGYRYYRNLLTREEVSTRFRSACSCSEDSDSYEPYSKPSIRWIGTRNDGFWGYPFWDKQDQKWVRISQSEGQSNPDRYISFDK